MPNYRRAFVPNGCWFFTHNLLNRRETLLVDRVDALRSAFEQTRRKFPFEIAAIVVLPDHMHAVWTLPPDDADFSTRWRLIKTAFAKSLPKKERLSAVRKARNERGIWQRRFWEHLIRAEPDSPRHVDYCYFNPVKHGLVTRCATGRIRYFTVMSNAGFSQSIGPAMLPLSAASVRHCRAGWTQ